MGVCEVLTLIFVTMKLLGVIDWTWWIVFSPMYPALLLYVVIVLFIAVGLFSLRH